MLSGIGPKEHLQKHGVCKRNVGLWFALSQKRLRWKV
jgi:hypothetical protein